MRYSTLNISMPPGMREQIDAEVAAGNFASSSDFIRDLVRNYLDDKRMERLVAAGLKDKNVTPLTKEDFVEMKSSLLAAFRNEKKDATDQ